MLPKPALLTQIYEPRAAALSTKSHPHLKINPANTAQLYGDRPVLPGAERGLTADFRGSWLAWMCPGIKCFLYRAAQTVPVFYSCFSSYQWDHKGLWWNLSSSREKTRAFPESFHQHNCGTFVGFWSSFLIPQLLGSHAWDVSRAPIFL